MTGHANAAINVMNRLPKHFTVVIISAEGVKIPASTRKTVSLYVTDVIDSGGTATLEMITPRTWKRDWANKAFKTLK